MAKSYWTDAAGDAIINGLEWIARKFPRVDLRSRLNQFFENKGLVKYDKGVAKFRPTIARVYRTDYGYHIIIGLYPGLSLEDLWKHAYALEHACCGEVRAYKDNSGWIHLKVFTRHLPNKFDYVPELAARIAKYPLALPVGVSRQGFETLKLYKDEEFALLISGMPGWGKSVFLRQALTAAILAYQPDKLHLYLIDMKRGVEFKPFLHVPHTRAWAGDITSAGTVLANAIIELNNRARLISDANVTNILEYNKIYSNNPLPRIILAIDEYADLDKELKCSVEEICRKGRFCGIHPIICTQRPTADTVPGSTKGLIPCIISFKMSSKANSRYILGEQNNHAAYLKNKGEAAFARGGFITRVQVMHLTPQDARSLINDKYPPEGPEIDVAGGQKFAPILVP